MIQSPPSSLLTISSGVTFQVPPDGKVFSVDLGWPISFNAYKNRRGHTSKAGRLWRDTIVDTIWAPLGGPPEPCIGPTAVWWEMWAPDDNRKRDLDNFTGKHCLDVLQKAKLMSNDSQVKLNVMIHRGKWKTGRVIVTVHEM